MKTFNRCNLPETITYNKTVYKVDKSINEVLTLTKYLTAYILAQKFLGKKVVLVNVLSRNLKGRTDLHGKLYKPSQWVFIG